MFSVDRMNLLMSDKACTDDDNSALEMEKSLEGKVMNDVEVIISLEISPSNTDFTM